MEKGKHPIIMSSMISRLMFFQSDMYRPNDVLVNGQRISNIFNTQDEDWHNKYIRPIRNFWTMTKVLDLEPLIDETLDKFVKKLDSKFVDGENAGTTCKADEWMAHCMCPVQWME